MGVPGSRVGLVLLLAVAVRLAGALCRSGPLAETRLHGPVHAGEQRRLPGAGRPAPGARRPAHAARRSCTPVLPARVRSHAYSALTTGARAGGGVVAWHASGTGGGDDAAAPGAAGRRGIPAANCKPGGALQTPPESVPLPSMRSSLWLRAGPRGGGARHPRAEGATHRRPGCALMACRGGAPGAELQGTAMDRGDGLVDAGGSDSDAAVLPRRPGNEPLSPSPPRGWGGADASKPPEVLTDDDGRCVGWTTLHACARRLTRRVVGVGVRRVLYDFVSDGSVRESLDALLSFSPATNWVRARSGCHLKTCAHTHNTQAGRQTDKRTHTYAHTHTQHAWHAVNLNAKPLNRGHQPRAFTNARQAWGP